MMKRGAAAAILIVAAMGAAATGNGARPAPSEQDAAAGFDPCTLMTKDEAATAVGEAVQQKPIRPPGSSMPGVAVSACDFEAPSMSHVQVTVWRPSGDSAAMFLQIYKSECLKKEQQAGLGDLACWYNKDHRELQVMKGTTLLIFEIRRSGNATEALTTVARKTLTRLP